jgi:hypothetical protein
MSRYSGSSERRTKFDKYDRKNGDKQTGHRNQN